MNFRRLDRNPRRRTQGGFTLLELVSSVAVFMVIVGVSSRVLVNFYVAMDITEQRAAATQNCINILNELRGIQAEQGFSYPSSFLDAYAPGEVITDTSETPEEERMTTLPNEQITVQYATIEGNILDAAGVANENVVQVIVQSSWQTMKGGETATVTVSTLLSNS